MKRDAEEHVFMLDAMLYELQRIGDALDRIKPPPPRPKTPRSGPEEPRTFVTSRKW